MGGGGKGEWQDWGRGGERVCVGGGWGGDGDGNREGGMGGGGGGTGVGVLAGGGGEVGGVMGGTGQHGPSRCLPAMAAGLCTHKSVVYWVGRHQQMALFLGYERLLSPEFTALP